MAYTPIANVAINYRDYANNWIKAYEQGTTTPKPMALKADGSTQVAKLEINVDGFLVSAGGALVIPYISGIYDLWMFPTEAEADANDTSESLRIADGSQGASGSTTSEAIELTDGQTTVTTVAVNAETAVFYITGLRVDRGKLQSPTDYTVTNGSTIELTSSFPSGSVLSALGSVDIDGGAVTSVHGRVGAVSSQSGDYAGAQITNTPSGIIAATNTQSAIDEVASITSTNTSNIALNTADIEILQYDNPNNQTGTAYTLTFDTDKALSDEGKTIWMKNAAANTLTIPLNATQALPIDTVIMIMMEDIGVTSITAVAGVLLNTIDGGTGDLTQFAGVTLVQRSIDVWVATPLTVA